MREITVSMREVNMEKHILIVKFLMAMTEAKTLKQSFLKIRIMLIFLTN